VPARKSYAYTNSDTNPAAADTYSDAFGDAESVTNTYA
jgi:hypothetical protein